MNEARDERRNKEKDAPAAAPAGQTLNCNTTEIFQQFIQMQNASSIKTWAPKKK